MSEVETIEDIKYEDFSWNLKFDIAFLESAVGMKPMGINKHLQMAAISMFFAEKTGLSPPMKVFWNYLDGQYDLEALETDQGIKDQLTDQDGFELPDEYHELIEERRKILPEEKPSRAIKDYTRVRSKPETPKPKEENEIEKTEVRMKVENESDDETPLKVEKRSTGKGRTRVETPVSQPRTSTKRGKRISVKDEKELSPVVTSAKKVEKTDEDQPTKASKKLEETPAPKRTRKSEVDSISKKEAHPVGKRSLRSRGDDDSSSSPAPTPPPAKRARRF